MTEGRGRGQYDLEYRECPCFWGREPAKFVRRLPEWLTQSHRTALDLGAGEGKNAFHLANLGLSVHAVEVSRYAVRNFLDRMIADGVDNIDVTLCDVEQAGLLLEPSDVVVAYGLLHCLANRTRARAIVETMQALTRPGGITIVSAFTDRIPVPPEQSYLSPTLLRDDEILEWFGEEWEILAHENDTLVESHPTSLTEHEHSLFRLAARRSAR